MKRTVVALSLALVVLGTMPLLAQEASDKKNPASVETLREDLLRLGQELKISASEAGEMVSRWLSETGASIGAKAAAATIQTKIGVVQSINKDNLTFTIVEEDGKSLTYAATEETVISIQDPITGLQTPFTEGKNARFKNIKKEDWVHISYNLKDVVQNILPNGESSPIVVQNIDILR